MIITSSDSFIDPTAPCPEGISITSPSPPPTEHIFKDVQTDNLPSLCPEHLFASHNTVITAEEIMAGVEYDSEGERVENMAQDEIPTS